MADILIPANTIIIGFTGSICSGCSEFAKSLADKLSYPYYSLSTPIHELAEKKLAEGTISEISQDILQDIGNENRRENGATYFAACALSALDQEYRKTPFNGIIIDSIRNFGEVNLLKEWPRFYLISIHSDADKRWQRWSKTNPSKGREHFDEIDRRDSEENLLYGQQVEHCCYESDIAINNDEENVDFINPIEVNRYVWEKLKKYITLIVSGPQLNLRPQKDEKLMTLAYMESLFSSCSQRKVGAVIATKEGEVLSTGHNHVPNDEEPCLVRYGTCYRKYLRKKDASKIKNCPNCGQIIQIECPNCKSVMNGYKPKCENCHTEIKFEYICPNPDCKIDVYASFVPGGKKSIGKALDLCRALHAEENALVSLARLGNLGAENSVIYTTTFPCKLCANKIVQSGIKRVVYSEPYTMVDAEQILRRNRIKLERFEGVKSTAFFRLYGATMEGVG